MTSARDPCTRVCDALLDPAAPRPPGMGEHLATCASCRRLRDAQRAAERLAPPPARSLQAIGMDQVLARVRRRRRMRAAAGAVAAVGVALAATIGLRVKTSTPSGPGEDVFALADSVRDYAQREVASDDPALHAYAALAWLAPPPLRSLDLPSSSMAPSSQLGATAGGMSP